MSNFIRLSVPRQQNVQSNAIVVNATEQMIDASSSDACYITPIRTGSQVDALYYAPTSGEITYDLSGGGGGGGGGSSAWVYDSNKNFYGPSGESGAWSGEGNTACGYEVGKSLTGDYNVGMGWEAALDLSGNNNVGIGQQAAKDLSGSYNVGVGTLAAWTSTGDYNVGIGYEAAARTEGDNNIAIGKNANSGNNTFSNTIVINAALQPSLDPVASSRCYINPIRQATNTNALYYDTSTKEITYDLGGGGGTSLWKKTQISGNFYLETDVDVRGVNLPGH